MRKIAIVILLLVLTGCHDGSAHKEVIDGQECIVRRDRINNRVIALSCDWEKKADD